MGKQIQLIDGSGRFQEAAVEEFVSSRNIVPAGATYNTVSIMGPQSSGKSTLLNALVRTKCSKAGSIRPLHCANELRWGPGQEQASVSYLAEALQIPLRWLTTSCDICSWCRRDPELFCGASRLVNCICSLS